MAARFADETLTVGRAPNGKGEYLYLFNWGDQPAERVVTLPHKAALKNYWTGESLGQDAQGNTVCRHSRRTPRCCSRATYP